MSAKGMLLDGVVAVAAGVLASATMTPVTSKIYELQSTQSTEEESQASYGVADEVAVEKAARLVGISLSERQAEAAQRAMHSGLGVGLAPVYMALRHWTGLSPWRAGAVAGIGLFVVVDEGLNPLLGFTPPPGAYPLVTHLRGLAGHVVLGLTLAAAVEAGWALTGRRP